MKLLFDIKCIKCMRGWRFTILNKNYVHGSRFCVLFNSCSSDMMTSSNGNIFRVTGHLCGEFTGPGEFPTQRPVTRSFDVLFDLRLNKRLSKQSWGWWFETQSCSLWRHCNETAFPISFRFISLALGIQKNDTWVSMIILIALHIIRQRTCIPWYDIWQSKII